jgi:hypothetical protein
MYSHHFHQIVSTVKLKSLPSGIYNRPCSFALVVVIFSVAFLRTARKCVLWQILKTNDNHIFSMYLRPHAKCVVVVVVAAAAAVAAAVVDAVVQF